MIASGNRAAREGQETHYDVRHLAERLVLTERRLLVFPLGEVNGL
jgi:hypothetical protein